MLTKALDHDTKIFEVLSGPGVRHFLRLKTRAAPSARLGNGRSRLDHAPAPSNELSRVTWEGVSAHVTNARDTA
jgi:hypothetical protein